MGGEGGGIWPEARERAEPRKDPKPTLQAYPRYRLWYLGKAVFSKQILRKTLLIRIQSLLRFYRSKVRGKILGGFVDSHGVRWIRLLVRKPCSLKILQGTKDE